MPFRKPTHLAQVIKDAIRSVLPPGTGAIAVDYAFAEETWLAYADLAQLAQAIQNLALNAIQAMPNGGALRVGLVNAELHAGNEYALKAGRYLKLTMADTGEGIAPEIVPKVFDPNFTTRKFASGFGLTTADSIIRNHEGALVIASTKARGTTVTAWIPAAPEARPTTPPSPRLQPIGSSRAGIARILLMDDEESIRLIGSAFLKRRGYEVVAVSDGESAVRSFMAAKNAGNPFDLVILDLTVPGGMGGLEAIEAIRASDSRVRAIVSSGYSSDPVMAEYQKYGFDGCVPKPYELDQLTDAICRLTSQRCS